MSVITERFEEKCRECSEKTAVITVQDGKKFCRTFGQLYEDIKSFSGYFEKKGVLSGQKILLFAKISYRLVVFMIAAMRMGIAVMFVDISALQDDPGNGVCQGSCLTHHVLSVIRFLSCSRASLIRCPMLKSDTPAM